MVNIMKLKNGAELTKENLVNLIDEEGFVLGSAMRKNIEKGKLEYVAKHFKLEYKEENPDELAYEELRCKLRILTNRLHDLSNKYESGDIMLEAGLAADPKYRAEMNAQYEKDVQTKRDLIKEIASVRKEMHENAWWKFLTGNGQIPIAE